MALPRKVFRVPIICPVSVQLAGFAVNLASDGLPG